MTNDVEDNSHQPVSRDEARFAKIERALAVLSDPHHAEREMQRRREELETEARTVGAVLVDKKPKPTATSVQGSLAATVTTWLLLLEYVFNTPRELWEVTVLSGFITAALSASWALRGSLRRKELQP